MEYTKVSTVYRCRFCVDSGLVFAKSADGYLYVFKHQCNVGRERPENIKFWKQDDLVYYEPISNI